MNKRIMFVDDERQILRALKRLFHTTEHELLIANSGKEALEKLKTEHVDMLITDMRMPEMDGHQLLMHVKELYPKTIRIALSGYTDKKIVMSALDKNLAKIYLFKPWNNDEIIGIINGLFEFEKRLNDTNLLDFIKDIENLPTVPKLYSTISEMVEEERAVSDIAKSIENDQAIASRILRISNSAYFGAKTGDVNQAVMFIGLANVKNIILSNTVFGQQGNNVTQLGIEFKHSGVTNRIFNTMYSKLLKVPLANDSRSAGLLHNIGKGVLLLNSEKNIYKSDQEKKAMALELEALGVTHQQIGGYLLNWWELPLPIVEAAMFHHNPNSKEIVNKQLVNAVHVAQYYAWQVMGSQAEDDLIPSALDFLHITQSGIDKMLSSMDF